MAGARPADAVRRPPPLNRLRGRISAIAVAQILALPFVSTADRYRLGADSVAQPSVLLLPAQPMRPRLADPRVPYLADGSYIARWRLEKQDPAAPVSDVVQPIAFRIAEDVPAQWVPYVRRAVEAWNPVFESIGFRRALVERPAADTAAIERAIVIHFVESSTDGHGAPMTDPRTGEILSATIQMSTGIIQKLELNLLLGGVVDPRARLPLPDTVSGLALQFTVMHEVGHTLGLAHNFKAGAVYPTDSLRRPSFLRRWGMGASIMAYAGINYVAQPEDGVPLQDRIARPGPYDRWALAWGYRPIPEARTPEAERPILERWRLAQDTVPHLRASLPMFQDPAWVKRVGLDPGDQATALGADQIKSQEYALRHLSRVGATLDARRDTTKLQDYSLYFRVAQAWKSALSLVVEVVGGVTPQAPYPGDLEQVRLVPIDPAHQLEAMRFVLAHLFYGQDELVSKHVLARPHGAASPRLVLFEAVAAGWTAEAWQGVQQELLRELASWRRLTRVGAQGSPHGSGALSALCRELAALEQRLAAAAADASAPGRQEHAQALHALLAPSFDPTRGACRPSVLRSKKQA